MKHIILSAALGLGFATTALADPASGTWKVQGDTRRYLHVAIAPCGNKVCGTIRAAFDDTGAQDSNYEHIGRKMIWDMTPDGDGYYSDGKIWAPDTDKTYKSKMALKGSILEVKGCALAGLICRSYDWSRVN